MNDEVGPDQLGFPGWSGRFYHDVRLWLGRALW